MPGRKQGQHGLKVRECRGGKGEKISPSWEKGKYPEIVEYINSLSYESGLAVKKIMRGLQLVQDLEKRRIVIVKRQDHKTMKEVHTYMKEIREILEGVTFTPAGEIETIAPASQEKMHHMKRMSKRFVE